MMNSSRAAVLFLALATSAPVLQARQWRFAGVPTPLEAEFVGMKNGGVVLKDAQGKSFEFEWTNFSPADQQYLRSLTTAESHAAASAEPGKPITTRRSYTMKSVPTLTDQVTTLSGSSELHVTGTGDPVSGSTFLFTSPEAWLFLDHIPPSVVESRFLGRMRVGQAAATAGGNVRVAQYGSGAVVIPQPPDYAAMSVFSGKSLSGASIPLKCYEPYDTAKLGGLQGSPGSFVLRRGYMATIAEKENGTGASRNYVAQDHDVVVNQMPAGLDKGLGFIRVFPWRWVCKKGVAGKIWQGLNVGWFYDWNLDADSTPDLEYVPIRQNRSWPGLNQDWQKRGATHLLGFNEPDHKDQANLTVDDAISSWPVLLATGLRIGAPAPSDGGLGWLYQFIEKADAKGLRVDFVPVHYYRAISNPRDARGAADQFYQFLKAIHDRVKRPLWVTEWNNGANWTKAPEPDAKQQKEAVEKMIKMLDDTPFVERYSIYNWVKDSRRVKKEDGTLTPAGEAYRDKVSPLSFIQPVAK